MVDMPVGEKWQSPWLRHQRPFTRQVATAFQMSYPLRISVVVALALLACGLGGCGTINEKLSAGMSDAIPQWAGGLPADAPPRPGTLKYDEFMRERERKRLEPAASRDENSQPALEAGH